MSDLMELVNQCEVFDQKEEKVEAAIERANYLKMLGFDKAAGEIMQRATRKAKLNRVAEFKYVRITDEKIGEYLMSLAKNYNASRPQNPELQKRSGSSGFLSSLGLGAQLGEAARRRMERETQSLMFYSQMHDPYVWQTSSASFSMRYPTEIDTRVDVNGADWAPEQLASDEKESRYFKSMSASTVDSATSSSGSVGRYEWKEVLIQNYGAIPPQDVLLKLEEHKTRKVFDCFTIGSVSAVKDPLLMGRIDGIDGRWFIAQWGDDISLDDVI